MVRYSFQQVISNAKLGPFRDLIVSGKKTPVEIAKLEDFRQTFVHFVEYYLKMAGKSKHIAVLGRDLSVELKMSRRSLIMFKVCEHFSMIVYELPYLALSSSRIIEDAQFQKEVNKDVVKKTEVTVKKLQTVAVDAAYQEYGDLVSTALEDAVALYLTK